MEISLMIRPLAVALVLTAPAAGAGTPACDADHGGLVLPQGFCAWVVADDLGYARHLTVRDNGDIYVSLERRAGVPGGIVALQDTNGDGRADRRERFGEKGGTGIGIHEGHLYFAPDTEVRRYRLQAGELLPDGAPERIVAALPAGDTHGAKPFTFDGAGGLYVNIGAPSNACQPVDREPGLAGEEPCSLLEHSGGIWRFEADRPEQTPDQGRRYASGIRNAMALDWHPGGDVLYVVQHGRDQLHALWPAMFSAAQSAELPAEEMLRVVPGSRFPWPYCYFDHVQQRYVLAPEYGGDGRAVGSCADYPEPAVHFPGHYAPNDLKFYTGTQFPERYHGGAFIAFHGSWNRSPYHEAGYKVVFVPFDRRGPADEWELFADGFAGVPIVRHPGEARFRPTGLAVGPDGSLYIADSQQGRIWRVIYRGGEPGSLGR